MDRSDIGPKYAELAQLIADSLRQDPNGSLMYAEVEEGSVASTIFKDVGNSILYRECSFELIEKIYDIWDETDAHEKWRGIKYIIAAGKFSVEMIFDLGDDEDGYIDRSRKIAMERFANLEIDYSDPQ